MSASIRPLQELHARLPFALHDSALERSIFAIVGAHDAHGPASAFIPLNVGAARVLGMNWSDVLEGLERFG
jgi:hypothetical protein